MDALDALLSGFTRGGAPSARAAQPLVPDPGPPEDLLRRGQPVGGSRSAAVPVPSGRPQLPAHGGAVMLPSSQRRRAQSGGAASNGTACARPRSREPGIEAISGAPASWLPHGVRDGPGTADALLYSRGYGAPATADMPLATTTAAAAARLAPAHGYAAEQNARFRSYMEDDRCVVEAFAGRPECLFAAVYDGHGGRLAVDFAVAHLHSALAAELRASRNSDALGCLHRSFVRTDRMLLQAGAYHCGATAACVVFERDGVGRTLLHVANAGDTRCVLLGDAASAPRCLSVDHTPASNAAEVARVEAAGGRVVNQRVGGALAVSRALGDHALKGAGGGVVAEPHCATHHLAAEDRFLLLATDGVWDVLSLEQAHALALQHEAGPPDELAGRLVQAALRCGSRDNISALVLDLRGVQS